MRSRLIAVLSFGFLLANAQTFEAHAAYSLSAAVSTATGSGAEAVAIGDVTGDGRPDVVVTTTSADDHANDYHVVVFTQETDGSLRPPAKYPYLGSGNRISLVLADLNEDGLLDVVVGHAKGVTVLLADGSGGLLPGTLVPDGDAGTLTATDVDLDGHQDVISLGWDRGGTIFHGDGHGGFADIVPLASSASGENDQEIKDVTGDGVADLVVMSTQGVQVNLWVHAHDGATGLLPPVGYFTGHFVNGGMGIGDLDGDGRNDVVVAIDDNPPGSLVVFTQQVDGTLGSPMSIGTDSFPGTLDVDDIDGDGDDDVIVLHSDDIASVYLQSPGGGLGLERRYPGSGGDHAPQGLAVGDIDSDGCADLAIADHNAGLVVLYGQECFDRDGDGVFDPADVCPAVANPGQENSDADGAGDACDNCIQEPNASQSDGDSDGVGDACDVCPDVADRGQDDGDSDGLGDACDPCPAEAGPGGAACPADEGCGCRTDTEGKASTALVGLVIVVVLRRRRRQA